MGVWYHLDDQAGAKKFLGKEVLVTGTFDGLTGTIQVQSIAERTADDQKSATVEGGPVKQIEPAKNSAAPPAKSDTIAAAAPQVNPPQLPAGTVPQQSANSEFASKSGTRVPRRSQEPVAEAQGESELVLNLPEDPVGASSSVAVVSRRSIEVPADFKLREGRDGNNLVIGKPLKRIVPSYPAEAEQQRIEGTVKLHAVIGEDGTIQSIEPVSGPPLLVDAAVIATREWRFAPTTLDGHRIRTQQDISFVFRLPN